ncbi:AraC family transcriptional regulator [Paenibacillus sp. MMS20-IR301]|uniref:AraC family transcriptional regulator n=1 Tax=Paenibacillus sp. MMS20-IR301 TaxID=2895946 RepID=UPI0028E8847F|nr:AraC family transcriptional regulator [Paenibacillus sp. MMS20-IR301]WNS46086.1 AraC family transcriptional regulator [Paenibacillus sp. MMS20-IR301]
MNYKYELIKHDDIVPVKIILHTSGAEQYVPRHWHESVEISYVIRGRIDEIYVEGASYTSEQGDIVVINSNAVHSFSVSAGSDRLALTLQIPYEFIKESFSEMDRYSIHCVSRHMQEHSHKQRMKLSKLRDILGRITDAYLCYGSDPLADIEIKGLSYQLMYILLSHFLIEKPAGVIQTYKHLERLTSITNYIKQHYNQELPIEVLAARFSLTGEYLSRFFRKHIGMTILQYLNTIRLEHAYRDLMNTDISITRIAFEHGFPNEKSFSRVFKAVYRTTPHEYRKHRLGGRVQ